MIVIKMNYTLGDSIHNEIELLKNYQFNGCSCDENDDTKDDACGCQDCQCDSVNSL